MKIEMIGISTYLYRTTYKVGIGHTPFQFVYGLHPLLPT
jgi:hypothetical protein